MFRRISLSLLMVVLSMILLACSDNASNSNETNISKESEDKILLKVADSFPTTNDLSVEGIVYFMDRVEELTDGLVEFEYYPAEQIGKADSYLDLLLTKTIDIGYTSYSTDRLPLVEVSTLPGAYRTSFEGSQITWELVKNHLTEEEYLPQGVRPLYAVAIPQYQIATRNTPITSMDDIKGKKFRVTGTMEYVFDELGASPVFMPATEAYTAMERGTVDGLVFPFTSFKPYQIESLAKYSTKNASLGSFTVVYSINESVYKGMPDNVKQALEIASDEVVEHLSKYLDEKNEELIEEFSKDIEMYELSDDEIAEWSEALKPVWDRWAQDLDKRGLNGSKTVEQYKKIQDELNN